MSQQYVEETDSLNELSMNILIHAGNARELLVKGLNALEEMDFDVAEDLVKAARKEVVVAHGLQTETLQMEASGEQIRYSTLFCHAQDTLMTAQSEILIGEHMVRLFRKFAAKNN
ncbi:PTS lactose/cellobiose transporter subunit IIA [Enterococcus sp. SMC-9]|uniref:PTS lactose/cellobiose transporter subunit IIA n=1 Tax=Enterococcus sp. SMC-9 TaxID=2862343 RepID=UPI001E366B16|nr:PTS lactose/cellobiose transporter subunit IIA [Enterococcus sp. SMC-9]MCD1024455.1 PTS lactose/cellobiose transporter subunit IIA [Enterococcus sp. SMC-9]